MEFYVLSLVFFVKLLVSVVLLVVLLTYVFSFLSLVDIVTLNPHISTYMRQIGRNLNYYLFSVLLLVSENYLILIYSVELSSVVFHFVYLVVLFVSFLFPSNIAHVLFVYCVHLSHLFFLFFYFFQSLLFCFNSIFLRLLLLSICHR